MADSDNQIGDNEYEKVGELVAIFSRGETWYVNYQHAGRQVRKSLKTKSKKQARRNALAIEREILGGQFTPDTRPPLIADVAAAFLEVKVAEGLKPRTLQKYRHCVKLTNQLAEDLSLRQISQITPFFMNKFRKGRIEELSKRSGRDGQKTAANDLVTVREIVNYALATKLIHEDPLAGYEIKKVKPKPQPYWVQDELERILAAATRQPHHDVYCFLGWTGTRVGEVESLTWNDIDWENRVVKIQAKPGWTPKTGDARSIPISSEVCELLKRQPRRCAWVFSFPADARRPARQVRQRRLLDYLQRRLKKLGLPGHLHTFRHTFISLALTRCIPEATVRSWVGHVDEETIRRYTHIASQESHAAMRRLVDSIKERRSRS